MGVKTSPGKGSRYQREYRDRMRSQGFVKTEVWVPEPMQDEIRVHAEAMRDLWRKPFEGETGMWSVDALARALSVSDDGRSGRWTVEIEDGVTPCVVVTSHVHGDAQAFVSVCEGQLIVSALLFPVVAIRDVAEFNVNVLSTHKLFPLTTIGITPGPDGSAWYEVFGAMSVRTVNENVVLEVQVLFDNYIACAKAFSGDISSAFAA